MLEWKGVTVYQGGYGSDLSPDPRAPGHFYLLTDRGPNFDVPDESMKGFVVPDFTPRIGRYRLDGGRLVRVGEVMLRRADGTPITGLPNPPGAGGTGETPVALDGRRLPFDADGVDPEGMVALADGSFWLADEYGPSLVHVDAGGRIVERVSAAPAQGSVGGAAARRLPRVLVRRWPNRGLEGLTLLPDGRTLVTVLQSTLDNPSRAVRETSRVSRILLFDTASGATRQYLYEQDATDMSLSGVAALSGSAVLVVEHDRKLPGDTKKPATRKRVYRVDLAAATDVSDPDDGDAGLLLDGGRTPEELSPEKLRALGVAPAPKHLVADLVALGYPHDKPEGIALVDGGRTLAILNDDDFGIDADGRGGIKPKVLPLTGAVDRNEVYFLELDDEP